MRKSIIILLTAIFILLITSCTNSNVSQSEIYNGLNSDEIHIGIAYPVELRESDTYFSEGVELALSTINANGGVLGKKLSAVVRDDKDNTHTAMQIAETFYEQGITAVVGHWGTNICYFVEDIYEENEVVMITPDASGINLFEHNYDYVYRMVANNQVYSKAIADYMKKAGLEHIAIYYDDDKYGNDFSAVLESEMAKQGIVVIDRVSSITPSNVKTVTERWKAFGCDGVVLATNSHDVMESVELIHGMDNELPVFGADNIDRSDFINSLDGYTNPIYMASYRIDNLDSVFLSAFRAKYRHNPDIHAISGYESVYMLKDAMEAVGTTDATAIAKYLTELKDYKSISGTYTYNPDTFEFEGFNVAVRALTSK